MSSAVEVLKLARLLRVEPEELRFAAAAPADQLRAFREQMTDRLFEDGEDLARRAADAARLLPPGVLARIGRRALGPMLCARLAGRLEPALAVRVVGELDDEFLAESAAELDPRRAADVVCALPDERIAGVAALMAGAGEHVAMGRFVGHLSDGALAACVDRLGTEDLLRVGYVLERKERLDDVVALLDDDRLAEAAEIGRREGLDDEVDDLLEHLGPEQRGRVERALEAQGDDAVTAT